MSQQFVNKNLTCADYRRLLPSLIYSQMVVNPEEDVSRWLREYSQLIDTSVDMLETNYICSNISSVTDQTQSETIQQLGFNNKVTTRLTMEATENVEKINSQWMYQHPWKKF